MQTTANVLTALIAALHIYILLLEMFWWTTPRGRRAFGTTVEFAESTRVLAANQGLYNGFLAAGLIWGLALGPAGNDVKVFFLGCVAIAGLYGGLTASRKILFIQALPGAYSAWRLCCWPDLTLPNPTLSAQPAHPPIHPAGLTPAHHESPDPMTTSLDKVLYTAVATSTGGRDGRSVSSDGLLDVKLAPPKELGGPGGATNPEQLFCRRVFGLLHRRHETRGWHAKAGSAC
jgi:putative membrane protein